MASHATIADLRADVDAELLADHSDGELARLIRRASADVDDTVTEEPEPSVLADLDALRRATILTVEHRLTIGESAAITGGRVSIGHVTIDNDSTASGGLGGSLPRSALTVLRSAGLIQSAVSAL